MSNTGHVCEAFAALPSWFAAVPPGCRLRPMYLLCVQYSYSKRCPLSKWCLQTLQTLLTSPVGHAVCWPRPCLGLCAEPRLELCAEGAPDTLGFPCAAMLGCPAEPM